MSGKRLRPRLLTREDLAIWRTVARTVAPMHARALPPAEPKPAVAAVEAPAATSPPAIAAKPLAAPPERTFAPLERRMRLRLGRGQLDVQAVLDLHGLREADAHDTLRHFLRGAQQRESRLVLVITGKGSAMESGERRGVLRRNVPHWLRAPELRDIIVGFEEATLRHGGGGALYVRLRRPGRLHGDPQ